jgi:ribosomal protein L5
VKVIQAKIRLYKSDGDLIVFLDPIPPRLRSAMVKWALRSGMSTGAEMTNNSDEALDVLDSAVS